MPSISYVSPSKRVSSDSRCARAASMSLTVNVGTVPTFGVKDIDAARAHLESLGTRFDGDTYEIDGMVKLATFYDPDGNAWMLSQLLESDFREH